MFDFSCVCFYALCFSLLLIDEYIKKSFMLCRLAQERMTLSDLKWPFYASRAISAVAEILVRITYVQPFYFTFIVSFIYSF